MALTKLYAQNTSQASPYTNYGLATTTGTSTGVVLSTTASLYVELRSWYYLIPVGKEVVASSNINVSVDVSGISGSISCRFRVRLYRHNGISYQAVTESAYSTAFSTTGIKTLTATLSSAAIADDYIGLALEGYRTSGHGSVSTTIQVLDADTFIEPDITDAGGARRIFIVS